MCLVSTLDKTDWRKYLPRTKEFTVYKYLYKSKDTKLLQSPYKSLYKWFRGLNFAINNGSELWGFYSFLEPLSEHMFRCNLSFCKNSYIYKSYCFKFIVQKSDILQVGYQRYWIDNTYKEQENVLTIVSSKLFLPSLVPVKSYT